MRARVVWFVAGGAAGVVASVKARRAAYRLSTPGLVDQAAAAGLGWRAFRAELRDGMRARERDLVEQLSGELDPPVAEADVLRLDPLQHDTTNPEKKSPT